MPNPTDSDEFNQELFKGAARHAVKSVWHEFSNRAKADVQTAPRKAVFASEDCRKGELVLVGASSSFGVALAAKMPTTAYDAGPAHKKGYRVYIAPAKLVAEATRNESGGTKNPRSVVPHWLIQPTTDPKVANMERSGHKQEVAAGNEMINIPVPILKNSKAVKQGDQLLLYGPEKVVGLKREPSGPKSLGAKKKPRL